MASLRPEASQIAAPARSCNMPSTANATKPVSRDCDRQDPSTYWRSRCTQTLLQTRQKQREVRERSRRTGANAASLLPGNARDVKPFPARGCSPHPCTERRRYPRMRLAAIAVTPARTLRNQRAHPNTGAAPKSKPPASHPFPKTPSPPTRDTEAPSARGDTVSCGRQRHSAARTKAGPPRHSATRGPLPTPNLRLILGAEIRVETNPSRNTMPVGSGNSRFLDRNHEFLVASRSARYLHTGVGRPYVPRFAPLSANFLYYDDFLPAGVNHFPDVPICSGLRTHNLELFVGSWVYPDALPQGAFRHVHRRRHLGLLASPQRLESADRHHAAIATTHIPS